MLFQSILIFHIILALSLVALILMQHGKGANAGAAFGAGSAGSVFSARSANSFLYKLTAGIAFGFFVTSLTLAYLATNEVDKNTTRSIMEQVVEPATPVQVPVPATETKSSDIPD